MDDMTIIEILNRERYIHQYTVAVVSLDKGFISFRENIDSFWGFIEQFSLFSNRSEAVVLTHCPWDSIKEIQDLHVHGQHVHIIHIIRRNAKAKKGETIHIIFTDRHKSRHVWLKITLSIRVMTYHCQYT